MENLAKKKSIVIILIYRRHFVIFFFQSGKKKGSNPGGIHKSLTYRLFETFFAPFLMNKWVRPSVIVVFLAYFCSSMSVAPDLYVGLDQEISMPDDSYVLKYFNSMKVSQSECDVLK